MIFWGVFQSALVAGRQGIANGKVMQNRKIAKKSVVFFGGTPRFSSKVSDFLEAKFASCCHLDRWGNACNSVFIRLLLACMQNLLERITVNPRQCGGRPCVRGMRIRVSDVLDMFASGLDASQILAEMPDLEADDLKACMMFASLQK
jgi:uncharacterized protein (DUF433 family)